MLQTLYEGDTVGAVTELDPAYDWERLARKIVERRLELKWSQEHLAHEAGVTAKVVGQYESGKAPVGRYPHKLALVIHALGWSAGSDLDILRGGEPMNRLDRITDASDANDDLVFIMSNARLAGARSLKAMRAVLESDLERD